MMKPACELALLVVGCILLLAQRCPIVGQVVGVLGKFSRGNQMSKKVIFPPKMAFLGSFPTEVSLASTYSTPCQMYVGPSVGHTFFRCASIS